MSIYFLGRNTDKIKSTKYDRRKASGFWKYTLNIFQKEKTPEKKEARFLQEFDIYRDYNVDCIRADGIKICRDSLFVNSMKRKCSIKRKYV